MGKVFHKVLNCSKPYGIEYFAEVDERRWLTWADMRCKLGTFLLVHEPFFQNTAKNA